MARAGRETNTDADLQAAIRRRLEEQRRAAEEARAAAARDPFRGLAPVARAAESAGHAVGGAVEAARKVPGVEGGLNVLRTVSDTAVKTPLGAIALLADKAGLRTGLAEAARRRLEAEGRPLHELPKFATEELQGAFGKVASDPKQDAKARLLAGLASGAQSAGDFALPLVPGAGLVRGALGRAARAGRPAEAAPVSRVIEAPRRDAEARPAERTPERSGGTGHPKPPTYTSPLRPAEAPRAEAPRADAPPVEAAPGPHRFDFGLGDRTYRSPLRPAEAPRADAPTPTRIEPTGTLARTPKTGPSHARPEPDPRGPGYGARTFERLAPEEQNVIAREDAAAGGWTGQRRGVQTIAQTDALADDIEVQALRNVRPGTAANAEEIRALQKEIGRAATERRRLQKQVEDAGGPDHAPTEVKFALLRAAVDQATAQRAYAGVRTEAGRALRIMREAIDEAAAGGPRAYDRALEVFGGKDNADLFLRKLNDIWARPVDDTVKADQTYAFLRGMGEAKTAEKINELWVNSILSNPVTHEINFISNALFAVTQIPTRFAAATADAVMSGGGKLRPREVAFSETTAYTAGMLRGIQDGAKKAVAIFRHGYSHEDVARWTESGSMGRTQAISGKKGVALNLPTRLLAASDAIFKTMGRQGELYAQAARKASKEGLRGQDFARRTAELVKNPTDDILAAAEKQAKYVTFQSDPGAFTQSILKLRNAEVGPVQPLRFVIPFVQTPVNLAKRGFEYSPLGAIRALRGTAEERAFAFARAAVGSAILTFFAGKLMTGEVIGAAPEDRAERDEFYRQGKMPYSVRIGDQWVEFRRLEPAMTPLRWAAAAADVWKSSGQFDSALAAKAFGAITASLKDQTYVSGVNDLMEAMDDPEYAAPRFLGRLAGGLIPFSGALRAAASATDPYLRDAKDPIEQIAAGLPGLSQSVPARQDAMGRDIRRPDSKQDAGALQPVNKDTAIDPFQRVEDIHMAIIENRDSAEIVERELARLRSATDLKALAFAGHTLGGQKLSREQQRRYQQLAGEQVRADLFELFRGRVLPADERKKYGAGNYQDAPDDDVRAKMVQDTIEDARETAQKAIKAELGIVDKKPTKPASPVAPKGTTTPSRTSPLAPPDAKKPSGYESPLAPKKAPAPTQGTRPTSPRIESGDVRTIVSTTAQRKGIDPRLALATGVVESNLDPNAVGDTDTPHSSHGVFQERLRVGRGGFTTPDPDPARQTERFADDVRALLATGFRGTPGQIAAAVQRPFDPVGYARKVDAAYASLGGAVAPAPAPAKPYVSPLRPRR